MSTDYISAGLECLKCMQPGEPVTSSIICIERMQEIVQQNHGSSATVAVETSSAVGTSNTARPLSTHNVEDMFSSIPQLYTNTFDNFIPLYGPDSGGLIPVAEDGGMNWAFDIASFDLSSMFPKN